jgi:hypothetical protein
MTVAILNLVEVLYQEIAPAGRIAEQGPYLLASFRIDGATLQCSTDTRAFAFGLGLNCHA